MKTGNYNLLTLFVICGWGLFSCDERPSDSISSEADQPLIHLEQKERTTRANIRGLFLVNDSIGWASGSGGTFLRMTDGETWSSDTIAGYTHLDFRDVHAFDVNTAILVAADDSSIIIGTVDGGKTWNTKLIYRPGVPLFLDGIDFDGDIGYCYGDPIHSDFVVIESDKAFNRGGRVDTALIPNAFSNEAGFAASGTGIVADQGKVWFGTGGDSIARIYHKRSELEDWIVFPTPIRSGQGCGIFSLAKTNTTLIAVGGCYLDSTNTEANCAVSKDWGKTWELITENQPRGYRSCVSASTSIELLVTCGRTGIECSLDDGYNWIPLSDEGYYTCSLADSTGWLMGKRGKMAKISW